MTEKIRVGFDGDFQFKEIDDRRRRSGALGSFPEVLDPRRSGAPPRRQGQGDGRGQYPIDVRLPGMLYARILRCPLRRRDGEVHRPRSRPDDAGRARPPWPWPSPARRSASPARRSRPSPRTPPSGPTTRSRAIRVAYEPRPFVVGIETRRRSRTRLWSSRGRPTTKSFGRRGAVRAPSRSPATATSSGPRSTQQGQRRGGLPQGRRRRRGDLLDAGPDAHRPRDPRPRGALGGRRADRLGIHPGHLHQCATSSPSR